MRFKEGIMVLSVAKAANEEFLKLVRANGGRISFQDLKKFAARPEVKYGFGVDLIDIVLANRDLGKVDIDLKTKVVLVRQ
jgi:hypothetical protein